MKMPFTIDQFLQVFSNYNLAVFPVQFLLYIPAVLAMILLFVKKPFAPKAISIVLALLWLWMAIVYHFLFFSSINKMAYLFGSLFIVQAILFVYYGVINTKLKFDAGNFVYVAIAALIILYALVIYPVLSYYNNHIYPASPTFGLPCPTTIFTFGLLLWGSQRVPVALIVIPLLWSLVGFGAALSLGITEDTGLLAAGIITLVIIIIRNRKAHAG